jgi:hypothetical protein
MLASSVPFTWDRGLARHSSGRPLIPDFHSDEIHAHDPKGIEVWKVPGAVHTGAHNVLPLEFERRVLCWFQSPSSSSE